MYHEIIREGEGRVLAAIAAPPKTAAQFSPPAPIRARLIRRLWREPLTHFVTIGVAIFIVAHVIEARSQRYVIDIGQGDLTRIANSYAQQYGAPPSPEQLRTMVGNYVREEIYLREGLALGLDRNDEIVRRRVAQKFDFLQQDNATPREPTENQLRDYYAAHRNLFSASPRRSFEQLYFSTDQSGEAAARQRADLAAVAVKSGKHVPAADEFPGPKAIATLSADEIERLFGGTDFATAVFAASPGQWTGPIRSGFGWHLIKVTQQESGHQRSFAEAREDVRRAWIEADRVARNDAAYRGLLARYTVDLPQ